MPTWLWIVILVVVIIGIGIGLRMRNADAPTAGVTTPATSASPEPEPVASDISVARATTSSDADPPAERFDDAARETATEVPEDAELRQDDGYSESFDPQLDPEPDPDPEPEPDLEPEPDPEPIASDVSVARAATSSDAGPGTAIPDVLDVLDVPDVPDVPDGEYGPGSAAPTADGSAPAGFPVKANADSMLFSTDDSPGYRRSTADVYFRDAGTAEAAGFKRWDDHRS